MSSSKVILTQKNYEDVVSGHSLIEKEKHPLQTKVAKTESYNLFCNRMKIYLSILLKMKACSQHQIHFNMF